MRKTVIIIKGLILLILFSQNNRVFSQDFGKFPFRQCWQKSAENISRIIIASDNDIPFVLSLTEGSAELSETITGKTIWQSRIGGEILPSISADDNKLFIVSKTYDSDKKAEITKIKSGNSNEFQSEQTVLLTINSLSKRTGITNWQKSFSALPGEKAYIYSVGERLLVLTETGHQLFLNKNGGEILSEDMLRFSPASIPFHLENKLFFGSDYRLVTLSALTGQIEKQWKLKLTPNIVFAADVKTLIVSSKTGSILSVNNEDGKINWQIQAGAEISSITKTDRGLLVSSFDNYVYLLSEKNGKRIWRKRLAGRSIGNPILKDEVAVFSTLNGNDVVFLDLKKGKIINRILLNNENYFISNPLAVGDLILFHTFRGLLAYGYENRCGTGSK